MNDTQDLRGALADPVNVSGKSVVCCQAIKAALADPVRSLRYE
jgi:hypothetical protein